MMRSQTALPGRLYAAAPLAALLLAGCAAHNASSPAAAAPASAPAAAPAASSPTASSPTASDKAAASAAPASPDAAAGTATAPPASGPGAAAGTPSTGTASTGDTVATLDPRETHLANLKQLTFGGENAEAYFSFDGSRLSFQSTRDDLKCDQIFTMKRDGSDVRPVSSGQGRTTCAYYTPDGEGVIYASTHLAGPDCPPVPDMSHGYTWPLYDSYDIFTVRLKDGQITRLTDAPGYDAEATVSPDGKKIIFTSTRDGDIELYTMDLDGKNVKRITHTPGYDGGAFFSHDSKKIVWRASRPEGTGLEDFRGLLKKGLVRPNRLDLYVANVDGTDVKRLTDNGAANFAPFFLPDDSGVIFSSNMDDPKGRNFDLYTVKLDGTGLTRITFHETFDGFPMFSPDGKQLVFSSNRNAKKRGDTNVFIADWKP